MWQKAGQIILMGYLVTEVFSLQESHRQRRVVGGDYTNIDQYPYHVALLYSGKYICSGSLIHLNIIVTAGHCLVDRKAGEFLIRAGTTDYTKPSFQSNIKTIIVHPKYNSEIYDYDIGLMEIPENQFKVPLSLGYVSIIKLVDRSPLEYSEKLATLTGWGSTKNHLQVVQLKIIEQRTCKSLYFDNNITDRMFCAGYLDGGKDACAGDSGGPLTIDGKLLIGIVSTGIGCGEKSTPGVYTNVYRVRKWILWNIYKSNKH